jgi:murein DD-endopeptidase MepM/ murein hydrolase activator NlpD
LLQKWRDLFGKFIFSIRKCYRFINAQKLVQTESKSKFSPLGYAIIASIVLVFAVLYIFLIIHTRQHLSSAVIPNTTDKNTSATSSEQLIATPTNNTSPNHAPKITPPIPSKLIEQIVVVRKKDNLDKIFTRLQLNQKDAKSILKLGNTKILHNLRSGQKLIFYFAKNKLEKIVLPINITDTLVIDKHYARFRSHINHIEPTTRIQCRSFTIDRSIYSTAKKANISQSLIAKFITAFKNKGNISKILHNGDKITLVYKDYYINDKKINKTSDLVAAGYVHGKEIRKIIKFTDKSGNSAFYTAEGNSLTSPFIRYPLNFKRVSSPFSLNRLNPVSGVYREHTGVDFAANMGTPIKATSSGIVTFASRNGSYGNVAIIKHNQYTTLYGHMLRFASGMHVGGLVKQGQVIGYVGMTGRATGAHLHYEFRINNVPHDPLKVKLPDGEMIAKTYRAQFFKQAKPLLAQLNSVIHAPITPKNNLLQKKTSPKTASKKISKTKLNVKSKSSKSRGSTHATRPKPKGISAKSTKNKTPSHHNKRSKNKPR